MDELTIYWKASSLIWGVGIGCSDVLERFFQRFEKNVYDYFKVEKLDPGFQIIFENKEELKIPVIGMKFFVIWRNWRGQFNTIKKIYEESEFKYNFGMNKLVYEPGVSVIELFKLKYLKCL